MFTSPKAVVLAACVATFGLGCGPQEVDVDTSEPGIEGELEVEQAVKGGTHEPNYKFPWVVNVDSMCHGTLIDPKWVLTAAHCVGGSDIRVSYAVTDQFDGGVQRGQQYSKPSLRRAHIHPGYDQNFNNDIALLELEAPFKIDRYIQTAALPNSSPGVGTPTTVASRITHGGTTPQGSYAVVRGAVSAATSACYTNVNELCFQKDGTNLCGGDSGSGLTRYVGASLSSVGRATVVGVASLIPSGACSTTPGAPTLMMDVYGYKPWIEQITGKTWQQLQGDVRLKWDGMTSNGTMTLTCDKSGVPAKTFTGPMNAPGAELRMPCGAGYRVRATCNGISGAQLTSFTLTKTTLTGTSPQTTSFSFNKGSASHAVDVDGAHIYQFTCRVGPIKTF